MSGTGNAKKRIKILYFCIRGSVFRTYANRDSILDFQFSVFLQAFKINSKLRTTGSGIFRKIGNENSAFQIFHFRNQSIQIPDPLLQMHYFESSPRDHSIITGFRKFSQNWSDRRVSIDSQRLGLSLHVRINN
jgi:hypothetical protein